LQIDWVTAWAYDPTAVASTDTAPPTVSFGGLPSTVSGVANLTATASDPSGVTAVKWYVDGNEVQYDGDGAPWADAWDTRTVGNGQHTIFAKARDAKGNWGTSSSQAFNVGN
jgi:bacterial leucyl aminopeptidase